MRHAVRSLLRDRTYTTIALLTLAFGIAVNTVIFSIVDGVLLRPLAYRNPGRLVMINEIVPEVARSYPVLPVNARHFFEWRDHLASFSEMGIVDRLQMALTRSGEPEQVGGARVSANLLSMLGVQPQLGRNFLAEEDRPGHNQVAIITDGLWTRKFHRDPGIVGRAITLDGVPHTVVGVLAASFQFPRPQNQFANLLGKMDVLKPAALDRNGMDWFGEFNYMVIGRLRPGITVQSALAEMDVLQSSIATHFPEKLHLRAAISPLQDVMVGPARRGLLILFGAVGAVLLIVCVNLANLALARATGRGRELAIRTALGARRGQLVRYILTESLCVSLAGGIAAIAVAWALLRAVLYYAPASLPRVSEIHMDARALAFALGLSMVSGVLFGILPALRAAAADPQDSLRATTHTLTEGRHGLFTRELLVGFESGLSALLLIAAGLMIGSFARLLSVDKGFNADRLIATEITLPGNTYGDQKQRDSYLQKLSAKLESLPGVISAGIVSRLPLGGEDWVDVLQKEGENRPMGELPPVNMRFASPDYFRTMGISLLAGRVFAETDRKRNVAVISEHAARTAWPGQNAIGKRFNGGDPQEPLLEVVGVVRDVPVGLEEKPVVTAYLPYWTRSRTSMEAVVRTSMDPRAVAGSVRAAVWGIDPDTVVGEVRTMQSVVSDSVSGRQFQMWLITGFAASALLLASIGIYGVVSWSVARRRNEIGIRMALGAHTGDVHRLVMMHALRPVIGGLALGVAGALALGRVLNSVLFGVSAHDPLTIGIVIAVLTSVSALACYIPSRRAASGDPLDALRYE